MDFQVMTEFRVLSQGKGPKGCRGFEKHEARVVTSKGISLINWNPGNLC